MTSSENFSVTSIVPVYNGGLYLAEALESLLKQTLPANEIIVLDDGSTDDTQRIAASFGHQLKYYHQSHQGCAAGRNAAILKASEELLAFQDSDDIAAVDRLEKQVNAFREDPKLEIVFGHMKEFVSPELAESFKKRFSVAPQAQPACCSGLMMMRKSSFHRIGLFDPELKVGYFLKWYARAKELNLKIKILPDLLIHRRIHHSNDSLNNPLLPIEFGKVLKDLMDKKRMVSGENFPYK